MSPNESRILPSLLPGMLMLAVIWFVHMIDVQADLELYRFGIFPRTVHGLIGIVTSPFLHSTVDYHHILNNSLPLFVLSFMLFSNYRNTASAVLLLSIFGAGAFTWFFGSANYHIGASGVIYALASYVFFAGVIRGKKSQVALSLLVAFLYGSIIWGVFPIEEGVSWEGHLGGFLSGAFLAFYFRKEDRDNRIYPYEAMEKMGIEPGHNFYPPLMPPPEEEEQGSSEDLPSADARPRVRVIYSFKPKEPQDDKSGN